MYEEGFELTDKTGAKIGALIKYLNSSEKTGTKFKNRVSTNRKHETQNEKQKKRFT